ncbi:MAG: hypothetical protein P0Y53_05990 [Candidatus Pseudobacter hemicellulosilyticus]|uniref:Uncharacterized protein n=1 Tax=Candidatus Pseudobacter hemicellulosilyticus TaxID=3121375 RepID=A0AAJ5WUV8_9BACT|nr:MAG: hypothetical protein P0Y53_05990 [Pseudobacter sp.]
MSEQDIFNDVSDEAFRHQLEKILETHARYLSSEQADTLQALLKRDLIEYDIAFRNVKEEYRGLLNKEEVKEIADRLAPYDKAATSFPYTRA